jgi:mRNA interferase MazF
VATPPAPVSASASRPAPLARTRAPGIAFPNGLSRGEIIGHLHGVTVAPITSTIRGVPSEVVIGPESGLENPSAINLDNVATVPKDGLRSYVGSVTPSVLQQVRDALLFALGFDDED